MANSKKRRKIRLNARGKAFLAGFCIIIILVAAIIIGINKAAGNQNTTE